MATKKQPAKTAERQECFTEGMYLGTSKQCKACDDEVECKEHSGKLAAKAQEAKAPKKKTPPKKKATPKKKTTSKTPPKKKATPKKEKVVKPKRPKIKDRALELLQDKSLAKKTYEELAEIIRGEIEGSKTTGPCISWYYTNFKDGMDLVARQTKGRPKTRKEEEDEE